MSRRRRAFGVALGVVLGLGAGHFGVRARARLDPPKVSVPADAAPHARLSREGNLRVVHLSGTPEQIGFSHSRLLRDDMLHNEGVLSREFERAVRPAPLRWLLLDLAQLRYRDLDRELDPARRRELSAGALGFSPDPFAGVFPTYQRFVYLNALYDIALSFEHSPLIGCTTFTWAEPGSTLLARAFDFDVHDVFDQQKAVFFVREAGQIPFASVAWPGLVGVVSGMNQAGLALVVHGGRAGEPRAQGEPVVHALRRVLSTARSVDEAARVFAERDPMVSHIVIAADASGHAAAIERAPGLPPHVRALPARAAVANHFHGPLAGDPKNQRVRRDTTTLDREARATELVGALDHPATVEDAVRLLRDRSAAGGAPLPAGDRRAIDADIATHGVVFDSNRRVLWVSEAPHLSGRFVAFELDVELAEAPKAPAEARRSVAARP
ncbi:MAG: hypothetical protein HYZ29_24430 [Myxococcales bacterium]|nr:hypothetical protein [Myxococcales bacterium]